jgi:hypothetical protein
LSQAGTRNTTPTIAEHNAVRGDIGPSFEAGGRHHHHAPSMTPDDSESAAAGLNCGTMGASTIRSGGMKCPGCQQQMEPVPRRRPSGREMLVPDERDHHGLSIRMTSDPSCVSVMSCSCSFGLSKPVDMGGVWNILKGGAAVRLSRAASQRRAARLPPAAPPRPPRGRCPPLPRARGVLAGTPGRPCHRSFRRRAR